MDEIIKIKKITKKDRKEAHKYLDDMFDIGNGFVIIGNPETQETYYLYRGLCSNCVIENVKESFNEASKQEDIDGIECEKDHNVIN